MKKTIAAGRYAKSILTLAIEKGIEKEIFNDISLIYNICLHNRDFVVFLRSPIIIPDKKINVYKKIFENRISNLTFTFIKLLTKKHREELLPEIAKNFIIKYKEYKKIKTIYVTSAIPLDIDLKEKIANLLKQKSYETIEIKEKIDKKIIGGIILRIDDKQIDASIRTKLLKIKYKLKNTLQMKFLTQNSLYF